MIREQFQPKISRNSEIQEIVHKNLSRASLVHNFVKESGITTKLPEFEQHQKIIGNYANPQIPETKLTNAEKENYSQQLENALDNADSVQLFFYYPFCISRCEGCRYSIVTLREENLRLNSENIENNSHKTPVDSAKEYSDAQLEQFVSYGITKPIDVIYHGGGTANLQSVESIIRFYTQAKERGVNFEKVKEVTYEGNPTNFTVKYIQDLVNFHSQFFGEKTKIRFSVGGFGFDISGRTESENSVNKAIKTILAINPDSVINLDSVIGHKENDLEFQKTRLKEAFELGCRQFTLYGLEKDFNNQSTLDQYLKERLELQKFIQKLVERENKIEDSCLICKLSPDTLGGSWITIEDSNNNTKEIDYLKGRWDDSKQTPLIGIGSNSYGLIDIGDGKLIRFTTPSDVEEYKKKKTELNLDQYNLENLKIQIYNYNLKALNELHLSGRLYLDLIVGQNMKIYVQGLKKLFPKRFAVQVDENNRKFINFNNVLGILEQTMYILSKNLPYDPTTTNTTLSGC